MRGPPYRSSSRRAHAEEDGFDLARQSAEPAVAGAAIIMLTSASRPATRRAAASSVWRSPDEPVTSWELRQLICRVLDRDAEKPQRPRGQGRLAERGAVRAAARFWWLRIIG